LKHWIKILVCFVTLAGPTLAGTASAQTSTDEPNAMPESSSAPVAFVYVSRPTHVDGFAVSSAGKLTAVPGSPFANIDFFHMSVNKKFLFGAGDDQKTISTYSIASNGALKKVGQIDTSLYNDDTDCGGPNPTSIDHTGVTVYNWQDNCDDTGVTQSYEIEESGELKFLNRVLTTEDLSITATMLLGNNEFAYNFGSAFENPGVQNFTFRRENDGTLSYVNATMNFPKPSVSGDVYDVDKSSAADSTDHIVLSLYEVNLNSGDSVGPHRLYSYTADSKGDLKTTNTLGNAPSPEVNGELGPMSISPSNKLLAIGAGALNSAKGFQVFHFNGADAITKYTGVLHSSEYFLQFGWDKSNHLFALSNNNLHIYNATSTSIKEESGSPISIPEASSVIVLSLQ
jgi:hypothetical protein